MSIRNYYRYELRNNRKIVYLGITDNPERRESEHLSEGKRFTNMNIVVPKVVKNAAEKWEEKQLTTYIINHNGNTPKYNKTEK